MKRTTADTTIFFALLIFVFLICIFKVIAYDIWLHLNGGQYILQHFALPATDVFSFTANQNTWINQEWLTQVLFYLIYSVAGFAGLTVFKALIAALTIALCYRTMKQRGKEAFLVFWTLVLTALMVRFRWTERPEIFTVLFLVVFQSQYFKFKDNQRDNLWLLPVLMVLWINLHFAAILGLCLLGVITAAEGIKYALHRYGITQPLGLMSKKKIIHLILIWFLCAAAFLVNPWSFQIFPFLVEAYKFTLWQETIETVPPWTLPVFMFPVFWMSLGVYTIVVVRFFKKIDLADVLTFGFVAFMALKILRFIPAYGLLAAMILSSYLPLLGQRLPNLSKILRIFAKENIAILSILAIFLFLAFWPHYNFLRTFLFGLGLNEEKHPVEAIAFLKDQEIRGNIFNDIFYGGQLTWERYPENKIFIDGRNIVFGQKVLTEYYAVLGAKPGWQEILKRYHINIIFLGKKLAAGSSLMWELSHDDSWQLVYVDSRALIFLKNTSENKSVIEKFRYDLNVSSATQD